MLNGVVISGCRDNVSAWGGGGIWIISDFEDIRRVLGGRGRGKL